MLARTLATSGGRSVGTVRPRTQTTEVFYYEKSPEQPTAISCDNEVQPTPCCLNSRKRKSLDLLGNQRATELFIHRLKHLWHRLFSPVTKLLIWSEQSDDSALLFNIGRQRPQNWKLRAEAAQDATHVSGKSPANAISFMDWRPPLRWASSLWQMFIFVALIALKTRPPLWSSGQSSWLQIQGSRVRFLALQKKVVDLERGTLSLVSTTEELLDRKVAAPV
jgi:hypothetical protein